MKTFKLIGASGYIAERHFNAIKNVGGDLTHIYDINDSCGVVDKYFLDAKFCDSKDHFFYEKTDYTVICTPNDLHALHIYGANQTDTKVICEKPICIDSSFIGELNKMDIEINCILQLRYMDIELPEGDLLVEYYSPRGDWYYKSWKGDPDKSGGIATNIGIHIFDLLCYHLGEPEQVRKVKEGNDTLHCVLKFKDRECHIVLSTGTDMKPSRKIRNGDKTIDLSKNFTELHTKSYEEILAGRGFTPQDCLPSLKIAEALR